MGAPDLCPDCGSTSNVMETRRALDATRRRRACNDQGCGRRWTTCEVMVSGDYDYGQGKKRPVAVVVMPRTELQALSRATALLANILKHDDGGSEGEP